MSKSKAIGTRAETAVARFLAANGWPHAERRALRGRDDAGDLTGAPGICWSVKGGEAARAAGDGTIALWLAELDKQRGHAKADLGVLVLQRRGYSGDRAGSWWAVVAIGDLMALKNPDTPRDMRCIWPVRLLLADLVTLLRSAGYGEPLPEVPDGQR